jgi:predicted RNA-binding protein with PUA domain
MAVIRSALPDTERAVCTRCSGRKRVSVTGPRCPHCQGSGLEPRRLAPPASAEVARPILNELMNLGDDRKDWQNAKVAGALERRAEIREQIQEVVRRGAVAGISRGDMAKAVGVSPQQLDNIMRGDTTGRNR